MKSTNANNRNFLTHIKKKKRDDFDLKEGAWKLAYADFVTAMMCFFMLMWLLNTTPSQKLKSMAMYFKPTIGLFGKNDYAKNESIVDTKDIDTDSVINIDGQEISRSEQVQNIESKIMNELSSFSKSQDLMENISSKINQDGVEITIFDSNKKPMFKKGSAELTDDAKSILAQITKSIAYLPNRIVISGYTEKMNSFSVDGYNGWDLSAGRASNAMKVMQVNGLPEEKIAKLVAYGDNVPIDENDPYSSRNRRITVTVLSKWKVVDYKSPISKSALSLDE